MSYLFAFSWCLRDETDGIKSIHFNWTHVANSKRPSVDHPETVQLRLRVTRRSANYACALPAEVGKNSDLRVKISVLLTTAQTLSCVSYLVNNRGRLEIETV